MRITLDRITPLVGSHFSVQTSAGPVELVLTEATELPRRNLPEQFITPLSLIFRGPDSVTLSQDMYHIEHPELGSHTWLMAPVLPDSASFRPGVPLRPLYQVLFA